VVVFSVIWSAVVLMIIIGPSILWAHNTKTVDASLVLAEPPLIYLCMYFIYGCQLRVSLCIGGLLTTLNIWMVCLFGLPLGISRFSSLLYSHLVSNIDTYY
jgi:hypothetical protein